MYETAKATALLVLIAITTAVQQVLPIQEVLSIRIWRVVFAVIIGVFLCGVLNRPGERYVAGCLFWCICVLGMTALGSGTMWNEQGAEGYPPTLSTLVYRISLLTIYALTMYGLFVWRVNRDGYSLMFILLTGVVIVFYSYYMVSYGWCSFTSAEPSGYSIVRACVVELNIYWFIPVASILYIFITEMLRRLR